MDALELILTPVFELVFHSKKVNKWAKTGLFLTVALILPVVLLWDVSGITDSGKYIMYAIASGWMVGAIVVAIWGHKNNWKKW